ncbi:hypothetical protein SSX86_027885 [Deinandra increscens subsp. villosa]|uniref:Protein kinase domain-containing protein n=1 Tax=Deinandra increscens subsp. villosa TaxID=3103831 RepID=A0AAP0C9P4_9ASTR
MALFSGFGFYSVLILQVALSLTVVHAQDDQSGFISIDCGITEGSNYTDKKTGINYVSDTGFTDSGINGEILSTYKSNTLDLQLNTLRTFPQNTRNCYTLRPKQGKGNRVDVNLNPSLATDYEIIHLSSSDYIYVCLVNIGLGNPFISALELRLLDSTMYADDQSLILYARINLGTSETVRYGDDIYDRIWYPRTTIGTTNVQTSSPVSSGSSKEKVPSKVMSTAIIPTNPTADYLFFQWNAEEYIMYTHFAEIETLEINQTREFNIYRNELYMGGPISPLDHNTSTYFIPVFNPSSKLWNLSSSGLSGEIAPALANLTMIQSLDLSYNNLTGSVPKFLASLDFLRILYLTGNSFTRPLPAELLEKAKNGRLSLRFEAVGSDQDNTGTCPKGSCKKNKINKVVIAVIATLAALLVLVTILIVLWIAKRRRIQEVLEITKNFSNVIGKGGFGTVFSGLIENTQVAVKMLSESSAQGYKEFQAEVRLLMSVHHKNITSLLGYCEEGNHRGIIYEYMANENLGMHLFGLEYMHHGCKPPIVHRDVKCSNILLNENLQAKLADFGLSRAFATESDTHVSTVVAGTPGYMDPEYYTTSRLSEKSDVYSFGVVLLELVAGRPAVSTDIYITDWVTSIVEKGSVEDIIDPRLRKDFEVNTAWKVVELAMTCVDKSSVKRPTMNYVVTVLKNCLEEDTTNNLNQNMSLILEGMSGPNLR